MDFCRHMELLTLNNILQTPLWLGAARTVFHRPRAVRGDTATVRTVWDVRVHSVIREMERYRPKNGLRTCRARPRTIRLLFKDRTRRRDGGNWPFASTLSSSYAFTYGRVLTSWQWTGAVSDFISGQSHDLACKFSPSYLSF